MNSNADLFLHISGSSLSVDEKTDKPKQKLPRGEVETTWRWSNSILLAQSWDKKRTKKMDTKYRNMNWSSTSRNETGMRDNEQDLSWRSYFTLGSAIFFAWHAVYSLFPCCYNLCFLILASMKLFWICVGTTQWRQVKKLVQFRRNRTSEQYRMTFTIIAAGKKESKEMGRERDW